MTGARSRAEVGAAGGEQGVGRGRGGARAPRAEAGGGEQASASGTSASSSSPAGPAWTTPSVRGPSGTSMWPAARAARARRSNVASPAPPADAGRAVRLGPGESLAPRAAAIAARTAARPPDHDPPADERRRDAGPVGGEAAHRGPGLAASRTVRITAACAGSHAVAKPAIRRPSQGATSRPKRTPSRPASARREGPGRRFPEGRQRPSLVFGRREIGRDEEQRVARGESGEVSAGAAAGRAPARRERRQRARR